MELGREWQGGGFREVSRALAKFIFFLVVVPQTAH